MSTRSDDPPSNHLPSREDLLNSGSAPSPFNLSQTHPLPSRFPAEFVPARPALPKSRFLKTVPSLHGTVMMAVPTITSTSMPFTCYTALESIIKTMPNDISVADSIFPLLPQPPNTLSKRAADGNGLPQGTAQGLPSGAGQILLFLALGGKYKDCASGVRRRVRKPWQLRSPGTHKESPKDRKRRLSAWGGSQPQESSSGNL